MINDPLARAALEHESHRNAFPQESNYSVEQYPLPGALKSPKLAVKLAVVIREKVQKAKFWTAGGFMHSFILPEQLTSFRPFLAKILNKW